MTIKKKTNETIDQELIGRNIIRLDDYIGANTKISFWCKICNYIWKTTPDSVIRGKTGCAQCKNILPLNNNIVDGRLKNRNIKRFDDFISVNKKIRFLCLENNCNHIWLATPGSIFKGGGCPKCAGQIPLTNEIVDERLKDRNIKRLEDIVDCKTPIFWQCTISNCNYIWKTRPNKVINARKQGCAKCAKNAKYTNESVDVILLEKNIKRLDNIINSKTKISFQCLNKECNNIWETTPTILISANCGCPKCSRKNNVSSLKLNNQIIDDRLNGRNIQRLDDFINIKVKIRFLCLNKECNHIWLATPSNIINYYRGCPQCKTGKNEKLVKRILEENNIELEHNFNIKNINILATNSFKIDFYIKNKKVAIEYNGAQHYEPVCFGGIDIERAKVNFIKQQARDQYIERFCLDNNIKLIWIDGRKLINKKLENYIINDLIPNYILTVRKD